jgi:CDP-glucose 4,6-dehydratase
MKAYSFWRGRRIFLTGHTGFMGGWLSCFLTRLGAEVTGYALAPQTTPSFCVAAGLEQRIHHSVIADVRDAGRISSEMAAAGPEVVFHLAAQPIVRAANADPVLTYDVNADSLPRRRYNSTVFPQRKDTQQRE